MPQSLETAGNPFVIPKLDQTQVLANLRPLSFGSNPVQMKGLGGWDIKSAQPELVGEGIAKGLAAVSTAYTDKQEKLRLEKIQKDKEDTEHKIQEQHLKAQQDHQTELFEEEKRHHKAVEDRANDARPTPASDTLPGEDGGGFVGTLKAALPTSSAAKGPLSEAPLPSEAMTKDIGLAPTSMGGDPMAGDESILAEAPLAKAALPTVPAQPAAPNPLFNASMPQMQAAPAAAPAQGKWAGWTGTIPHVTPEAESRFKQEWAAQNPELAKVGVWKAETPYHAGGKDIVWHPEPPTALAAEVRKSAPLAHKEANDEASGFVGQVESLEKGYGKMMEGASPILRKAFNSAKALLDPNVSSKARRVLEQDLKDAFVTFGSGRTSVTEGHFNTFENAKQAYGDRLEKAWDTLTQGRTLDPVVVKAITSQMAEYWNEMSDQYNTRLPTLRDDLKGHVAKGLFKPRQINDAPRMVTQEDAIKAHEDYLSERQQFESARGQLLTNWTGSPEQKALAERLKQKKADLDAKQAEIVSMKSEAERLGASAAPVLHAKLWGAHVSEFPKKVSDAAPRTVADDQ